MCRWWALEPAERHGRVVVSEVAIRWPTPAHLLSERQPAAAARGAHLTARSQLSVRRRRVRSDTGARRQRTTTAGEPGAPGEQPAAAAHPRPAQQRAMDRHRRATDQRQWRGNLYVYLQVSRGAEYGRNHAPLPDIEPTVSVSVPRCRCRARSCWNRAWPASRPATRAGRAAISSRWRCWPTCCCASRHRKRRRGGDTAARWQPERASASSVEVIIDGEILTPPNSQRLLPEPPAT